mmetsp:Transcript_32362/g.86776  ORF Transcript_32362/g.86776 Transcript_32362/m.86776 type:complete len:251 (+) Transcript_32362:209-961(+)
MHIQKISQRRALPGYPTTSATDIPTLCTRHAFRQLVDKGRLFRHLCPQLPGARCLVLQGASHCKELVSTRVRVAARFPSRADRAQTSDLGSVLRAGLGLLLQFRAKTTLVAVTCTGVPLALHQRCLQEFVPLTIHMVQRRYLRSQVRLVAACLHPTRLHTVFNPPVAVLHLLQEQILCNTVLEALVPRMFQRGLCHVTPSCALFPKLRILRELLLQTTLLLDCARELLAKLFILQLPELHLAELVGFGRA